LSENFAIKIKIWFEKDDKSIIGPGRMAILEAIEKTGSLTEATKICGISFRKGWKLMNEINEALEQPVIISERGGKGGGGQSRITEFGKKLMKQYEQTKKEIRKVLPTAYFD
jgi:molybdate transport repressor ModE-like protein